MSAARGGRSDEIRPRPHHDRRKSWIPITASTRGGYSGRGGKRGGRRGGASGGAGGEICLDPVLRIQILGDTHMGEDFLAGIQIPHGNDEATISCPE